MRLLLLVLAGLGIWFLIRGRRSESRRVVVVWEDGSEIALRPGSPQRARLVAIAEEALS